MPTAKKIEGFIERSSWIRAMFEAGAKLIAEHGREKVCDFSLGNPILEPPPSFYESLRRICASPAPGLHAYMPNSGYPQVRAKVAAFLSGLHQVEFGPAEVVMAVGAGGGLNAVLKTLIDPGCNAVVPTPYFVEYDFYLDNHGGVVKRVPTKPDFSLDVAAIAEAVDEDTRLVLINSPNNPTGAVYTRAQLSELAAALEEIGRRRGRPVYLVNDEPYRDIVFDGREVPSVFGLYEQSIVVTSFSKNLSLAGERIGYVAVHPRAADKELLLAGIVLCTRILGYVNAPGLMQRVVADIIGQTSDMSQYSKKRDLICSVLDEAGFDYQRPGGAFYIFPQSPIEDDVKFVQAAQEELVLLVPGSGFMGPGHFRVAFCVADEVIERSAPAFKRIRERF